MKPKSILAVLLFFAIVIGTYLVNFVNKNEVLEVRAVFSANDLKANCDIKEIKELEEDYEIEIYYPESKYSLLNEKIKNKMEKYINEFKEEIKEFEKIGDNKFTLSINFDSYEYEEYISYVFHIFVDLQGAHPNTYIWTISYDIKSKELIDINTLVRKNKDILNILSGYAYEELKQNSSIKEDNTLDMLVDGTKPVSDNFSKFAFTKEGLKVFFQRYDVAPYYLGEFEVTVPYDKLNIL